METKLYTIQEVADILRLNQMTVRRYCNRGILKFIQYPGADIRIEAEEVERFIRDNTKLMARG
jgi:excisionase family DNA binding protein